MGWASDAPRLSAHAMAMHSGPDDGCDDCERGKALARKLRQACWDTGSPVVPTPVADAIRAVTEWADA